MKTSKTVLYATVTIVLIIAGYSHAYYTVVDLGTLEGPSSYAASVNNEQIAGAADNNSGGFNACLFNPADSSQNKNLGTLGGANSEAYGINSSGNIVGYAMNSSGYERACLFDNTGSGANTDLGTLGGDWSSASSINANNQIAGVAGVNSSYGHACLFNTGGGANTDLGTLGGDWSSAYSINNSGRIVGKANNSVNTKRACLFDPNGGGANIDLGSFTNWMPMKDDPNINWSVAYSINNNNQIVGEAYAYFGSTSYFASHACLFDSNGVDEKGNLNNIDLGVLDDPDWNSIARCINDNGQIVGAVYYGLDWRACLFDPNGVDWSGHSDNIDLNTLIDPGCGWLLTDAWSINNDGWIVGQGVNPEGQDRAFLLIIPEPVSALTMIAGLVMLTRRNKKH